MHTYAEGFLGLESQPLRYDARPGHHDRGAVHDRVFALEDLGFHTPPTVSLRAADMDRSRRCGRQAHEAGTRCPVRLAAFLRQEKRQDAPVRRALR